MEAKRCTVCKEEKPISEFAIKDRAKDKYSSECKKCHGIYRRKHYQANRAREIERTNARRKEIVAWVEELKSKLSCISCGESHPGCIDFHHRDPEEKEMDISLAAQHGWSQERILKEIEKCDVLCSNCHRKLHWIERQ